MVHPVRLPYKLAGIIAPPRCATCAASCSADRVLCLGCDRELRRGSGHALRIPGTDQAWATRPYEGVARELVHALKFRHLLPVARRAAELIAAEAPASLSPGPYVPVPPDPLRSAWRGFDAAEAIATQLGPLSTCLRRRHHPRQVGRTRRERLAAEIDIRARGPVPKTTTLVDDVTTTGATLTACALALRTAGCEYVGAVVLAAARA
jgi:predicted amidophosphoribosyltransferase